jgi:hypothetical protein
MSMSMLIQTKITKSTSQNGEQAWEFLRKRSSAQLFTDTICQLSKINTLVGGLYGRGLSIYQSRDTLNVLAPMT